MTLLEHSLYTDCQRSVHTTMLCCVCACVDACVQVSCTCAACDAMCMLVFVDRTSIEASSLHPVHDLNQIL